MGTGVRGGLIVGFAFCVLLSSGTVTRGEVQEAGSPEQGAGRLVFQEKLVMFEGVFPGERVEYVFRYRNPGDMPVRILEVKPT